MDYKLSLKSRDAFIVKLGMHKQGRLRFVFDQAIFRKSDGKKVLEAEVIGVLTRDGRPVVPDLFDTVFADKGWEF